MPDTLKTHAHSHRRLRAALLLGLLVLVLVTVALLSYLRPHSTGQRIGVGDVLTLSKDRRVLSATLRDEDALVVGELRPGAGVLPKGGRFSAELPANGELTASLTALLAATGARVDVDHQSGKDRARLLLTTLIPVLALTDLVALVLLASPYGDRLGHLHDHHGPRGKHDLPAVTAPALEEPLPPEPPVASAEVATAARKAGGRKAATKAPVPREAPPTAPRKGAPRKAAPRKRTTPVAPADVATAAPKASGRKAPAKKTTASKAPAKAAPAQDVLPVKRTSRRTQT